MTPRRRSRRFALRAAGWRRGAWVTVAAGVLVSTALAPAVGQVDHAGGYHVARRVVLGGNGGWDYLTVDPVARRVYVARDTHVQVLDADRDSIVHDIVGTEGVHGIALAPGFGRGFTSDGRDATVTIFDLHTYGVIGRVLVTGRDPDAIVYDSVSRRVFTMNGGSDNATAIDAASGAVAGTIALGGRPEFAVADGRGRVYVNIENRSALAAIDARTLAVVGHWPLAPCEAPSGLAIDREHRRLFAGCRNKLMAVIDADSGHVITTLPIGAGVDADRFDPETQLAFASCGDGTVTIVHEDAPDRFAVAGVLATQRGARTMALDAATHAIFLVTAQFGPPAAGGVRSRPTIVPGTFTLLVAEQSR